MDYAREQLAKALAALDKHTKETDRVLYNKGLHRSADTSGSNWQERRAYLNACVIEAARTLLKVLP